MSLDIQQVISDLERAKPMLGLIPPPAGPLAVVGLELAELIAAFVDEAQHQQAIDTMKQWLRTGAHGTVQAFLDAEFPNG
jgi:hypothetical protein